jgi:hypothetical protein
LIDATRLKDDRGKLPGSFRFQYLTFKLLQPLLQLVSFRDEIRL